MTGAEPLSPPGPARYSSRRWPSLSFWVAAGLLLVAAAVMAFIPLFNLLGYEFCVVLAVLVSVTAPLVAIGVVRQRPAAWREGIAAGQAVGSLALRAAALNLATLVLPLGIILLNAWRVKNCNLGEGFHFFLLLPVGGALLWTGSGILAGLLLPWRFLAGLATMLVWLLVAALNLAEFWSGPAMDSYNQITGLVAGPITQEVLHPDTTLLLSRVHGLLWGLLALALAGALFDPRMNRCRPGVLARNRRSLLAGCLLLLAALSLYLLGDRLGFVRSWAAVERLLAASERSEHFVIHHQPGWSAERKRLVVRDHEFRLTQVTRTLELKQSGLIHSWVFPSPAAKRRLTGAGSVQFVKPWQGNMFLNQSGFPHPVLKHELVHVVAAAFGSWPLRISSRAIIWQNVGLTEGLAVAVDWPSRPADPHRLTAALRRAGLAGDVRGLFDPLGFWTRSSRRAYTQAGSLVRFLLTGWGPLRLEQAYHTGSLEGVYPLPVSRLLDSWQEYLDGIQLQPVEVEAVKLQLGRPSIFQRTCAHEIAAIRQRARAALARGRLDLAREAWRQWQQHLPDDPDAAELQLQIAERRGQQQRARDILARLVEREDLPRARRTLLRARLADLQWRAGEPGPATAGWRELLAAHLGEASDRLAIVKLEAAGRDSAGGVALDFLDRGRPHAGWLLRLREAAEEYPGWSSLWYLIGRQMFNQEHFEQALTYLERAGREGFGHPLLSGEALRLQAVSAYRLGRRREAALRLAVLAQLPARPDDPAWAGDWLERLAFEQRHYGGARYRPRGKKSRDSAR